jgi:hypothetical protein
MKWQLIATIIEDPGFTNRVSHVHLSIERDRLRCTCRGEKPIAYVSGNIEPPAFETACRHVRGLYDHSLLLPCTITFTQEGRAEFEWRYAVTKLSSSAR